MGEEVGVLFLDKDACIEAGEICYELFEDWKGGIGAGGDAEVDGQLGCWVALFKGRSKALVEIGFQALDRADDGDMRDSW